MHAEAFKAGTETGSTPSSRVTPGAPPQPHSTADQAPKVSERIAPVIARASPFAFLATPQQSRCMYKLRTIITVAAREWP